MYFSYTAFEVTKMIRIDIMISRDAVGLPKNGMALIEEETKKRILPFWPDAIISVRKGGGNQISVNGLKKGDKQTTIDKIIDMFDEANEWLYIEEQ